MKIHSAYDEPRSLEPGEIRQGAGTFLKEIPLGHSVVFLSGACGEPDFFGYNDYVYDPDFRVEGERYFKVLKKNHLGDITPCWNGERIYS